MSRAALVVAALAALVAAGCASVPSEDEGYWSQFRCEGDCDEGSGCPYCCGE